MSEQFVIEGFVDSIIYANKDNGYFVFSLSFGEEEIVCVGYMQEIFEGENLKIVGHFVKHHAYGKQLHVDSLTKIAPNTLQGIERYLGSGVIKGIGQRLAKRIVDKFGFDTFDIIESEPEKLTVIKGISLKKATEISEVFHEQAELRNIMVYLQGYGITPYMSMKIYKKYKGKTVDIISQNPYQLADDIFGIGFKLADEIALSIGIEPYSVHRIKSGIRYLLTQSGNNGHTYLPKGLLITECSNMLDIDNSYIESGIIELIVETKIVSTTLNDIEVIYLWYYYNAEKYVAKKLLELKFVYDKRKKENINEKIESFSKRKNILLADKQKEAITEAMTEGVLVITGGPGTGKTTIINAIIDILKQDDLDIVLAAPTGKAAKRMTEATGIEAKTVHRLLEMSYMGDEIRQQRFEKNEENPIEADVIIIDETSMMDITIMQSLLKAIELGSRLILVGDASQLPSVGAGNVLHDIIKSGIIPIARLTEIFRQAQESAIVMNAHRINNGEEPVLNEKKKDFFFVQRYSLEDAVTTVIDLLKNRLPAFKKCDSLKDIQVLTPMRKSPLGMQNLNELIQKELNPRSANKKEKELRGITLREGDKVMQIKNNYNIMWKTMEYGRVVDEGIGVFNGDEGCITNIDNTNEKIEVLFTDGKLVSYEFTQLDELEHAFAITIHKSQGSEYPVVIIPVHSGPPRLMSRNLLYTAITRARDLVVLVGTQETIKMMVQNSRESDRYSSLDVYIEHFHDIICANGIIPQNS